MDGREQRGLEIAATVKLRHKGSVPVPSAAAGDDREAVPGGRTVRRQRLHRQEQPGGRGERRSGAVHPLQERHHREGIGTVAEDVALLPVQPQRVPGEVPQALQHREHLLDD